MNVNVYYKKYKGRTREEIEKSNGMGDTRTIIRGSGNSRDVSKSNGELRIFTNGFKVCWTNDWLAPIEVLRIDIDNISLNDIEIQSEWKACEVLLKKDWGEIT